MLIAFDFDLTIIDIHTHGTWREDDDSQKVHELIEQHVRPEITCIIYECMKRNLQNNLHGSNTTILHVAVTTFSQQTQLVTNVMNELLTTKIVPYLIIEEQQKEEQGATTTQATTSHTTKINMSIPVYGGRNQEEPTGKEKQLQQAINDINNYYNSDSDDKTMTTERSSSTENHQQQHQKHHHSYHHQHVQHSQNQQQQKYHHQHHDQPQQQQVVITPQNTILIDDNYNNIRIAKQDGYKAVWFDPKKKKNHVANAKVAKEEDDDFVDLFFQLIIHYDDDNK